jgi:hypothetical protein
LTEVRFDIVLPPSVEHASDHVIIIGESDSSIIAARKYPPQPVTIAQVTSAKSVLLAFLVNDGNIGRWRLRLSHIPADAEWISGRKNAEEACIMAPDCFSQVVQLTFTYGFGQKAKNSESKSSKRHKYIQLKEPGNNFPDSITVIFGIK